MIFPSRNQLIRDLSLTRTDQMEISKRRGDPHRLGFAYQLGFVRVFQRFPVQQPLEICEELLSFVALQTGIDGGLLGDYASWQQTVSRHQIRIREYLGLRSFDPGQERGLEQFLYEESCRLEQTAALLARAREYLKQEKTVFPAESVLRRIIGEQRNEVFPSLQMGRFSPAALALLQLWVCPIPRQYFPSELRKVRPNRVFQVMSQGREVLPE